MEKIQLSDNIFIIDQGAVYTLAIESDDKVILFDSCLKKDGAKKIDKLFNKKISAVYNTHYHADHTGGNAYFENKFETVTYAPENEISFFRNTYLSPSFLCGGAAFKDICGSFLKAPLMRNVQPIPENAFFSDVEIKPIETKGHSPSHTCYKINNILFAGDAVCGTHVIEKYKLLYLFNPQEAYGSLNLLEETEFDIMVYCHKGAAKRDDAVKIIEFNKTHIREIKQKIYELAEEKTPEEIAQNIMDNEGIINTAETALLTTATVRGYLTWLENENLLSQKFQSGFRWKKNNLAGE